MRRGLVCLLVALAPIVAGAKPMPPAPEATVEPSFWRDLIEPHGDEVAMLVRKARETMREPRDAAEGDFEWAAEVRAQFFLDAFHLMRHARSLAPHNLEVLGLYAEAADELGKSREAIEALETAIRLVGPDAAGAAITARLGALHLRAGKLDTAIRWLRHTQGRANGASMVYLAHALAARGDLTGAIETLRGALPEQRFTYGQDAAIVAFALAVHLDRDEQRGAAFDALDALVRSQQQAYATTIKNELAALRLGGADTHYYRALLYESLGHYVEARAEWALYAGFPGALWRERALDHIARIDAQRRARPGPRTPPVQGMPPPIIRRRLPRGP